MGSDPATTAFVAFCRTGKPELLGEVFDRLAPELMLVAARLLGRGGDAPDVVQQTFLTALQQRRRFDPQRSVAPWLIGILVQHVRNERRRLRRRVDAQRLRHVDADDPLAVAAGRDEAEAIRRAVARMPQPYRQVLQLHLVHGLPANAVAASLERPFRTVQSQLRRGLEQLRKTLAPMALVPVTGRTLELVRADVLHAAASCFSFLLLPWLKVASLLAITLPLCVLTVAAVAKGAAASAPPLTEQQLVAVDPSTSPPLRPERHADAAPFARQPVQDPEPVCRVSLQVLRAEDQAPLAGARATAMVRDQDARGHLLPSREVGDVLTDEHGLAVLELPRASKRTAEIRIAGTGRLVIAKGLQVPDRETLTLHGLLLWQAVPGRIRVRDQDGAPVPFLDVMIRGFEGQQHGFSLLQGIRAPTDENGWTTNLELPPGDFHALLRRVPIEFAQGAEVELPLTLRGGDHELTLIRPDPKKTIRGSVVDQQGQPVSGAWVELLRASDDALLTGPQPIPSDRDGRFVLKVPEDERGPFRVRAGTGRRAGQIGDGTWFAGATDATVRLQSPDGLALTVVDARAGEAIEDFAVVCFRVHSDQHGLISGDSDLRCRGRHADGSLFVEGVEAGENRLLVLPDDNTWLPSGYLPVNIAEHGVTRLKVELRRPAPVRVRVRLGDGTPVAGSRIRLRARLEGDDRPWVFALDALRKGNVLGSHWQGRIDLAMATTDSNGIAELPWQPWREPVIVRADGPGHVVCQRELPGVDPEREPIELRVGLGATITGTVASMSRWRELLVDTLARRIERDFDRFRPCVVLRNAADGLLQHDCEGRAFPIQNDGTFACGDVPPGRWQVLFQYDRPDSIGEAGTVTLLHRPLAEIVAMPGKRHEIAFDLAQVLPGTLRGRILLDGEPCTATQLSVTSFGCDHLGHPLMNLGTSWDKYVHPDGTYLVGTLAGDVEFEAHIDGKLYCLFERIPLAPGEHKEADLRFRHLVARIQLVREDGTPVRNRVVRAGHLIWVGEDGWCTLDPVRELRFDVELLRPGIDRSELMRLMLTDPRLRTENLGHLELDPAQPTSEHRFVVREP